MSTGQEPTSGHQVRTCTKCGSFHRRRHAWCAACHGAYMREWRRTHRMSNEQRRKDTARSKAAMALRRGRLTPGPCVDCGCDDVEIHIPDYNRPLSVTWLCRDCRLDRLADAG